MYMGMHTLADIIGGLLAASALLFFLIPLGSNTTTNINTNIDTDTNEIQLQKGYKYKKIPQSLLSASASPFPHKI